MSELKPGDRAPDFDLPADGGGRARLADYAGKPVVLYVYPKDDTSGCTSEAKDFTALAPQFAAKGAVVVGLSKDSPKSHDKFKAKHDLDVVLASDEDTSVMQRYGVWVEKSMYGRKYMGAERATFLIGPDGAIEKVWRKVSVPGHAQAVLEALPG
ncbi:MAG: peroxiredoxin [Caulobacteraceae bacterium]|nr:peroxiredoxin [Caulobacter sp.]